MGRRRDEEEYIEKLEKQIRELKSVNRSLIRRLKKVDRDFKSSQQLQDHESKVHKEVTKQKKPEFDCPKCNQNNLKEINLGNRSYRTCVCGFREVIK